MKGAGIVAFGNQRGDERPPRVIHCALVSTLAFTAVLTPAAEPPRSALITSSFLRGLSLPPLSNGYAYTHNQISTIEEGNGV